jgi:hypothetical protein
MRCSTIRAWCACAFRAGDAAAWALLAHAAARCSTRISRSHSRRGTWRRRSPRGPSRSRRRRPASRSTGVCCGGCASAACAFATLTHAAGLSSTGDATLDARFPLPERYEIPVATAAAVTRARRAGGRVVAVGTTVVRALEHAGRRGLPHAGAGVADGRIGRATRLRIVDALLTGTHEPGTSHHELLRAFATDEVLGRVAAALAAHGYRTHEYGDSVLVERGLARP